MHRVTFTLVAICLVTSALSMAGQDAQGPVVAEPKVIVVAAQAKDLDENHYLWAAEMAAARLAGKTDVLEGGLAAALRYSRENPGSVQGIVEIVIDVHTVFEEVRVNCYDPKGRLLWKKKTELNAGGSEEKMARNMLERALKKAEKQPACGS